MRVGIVVDDDGCLTYCESSGHSGYGHRGEDIVCAAVSVLIRTAAETLGGGSGIRLIWEAPVRGEFRFRIEGVNASIRDRNWEKGAAAFLTVGLNKVARDYPDHLEVVIQHK